MRMDLRLAGQMWGFCRDPSLSSYEKGVAFEWFVAYAFSTGVGLEGRGRVRTLDSEIDLLLRKTERTPEDLGFLDDYLIVECKNTADKVTGSVLKNAASNVRHGGCRVGVVATTSAISGSDGTEDARYTQRKLYHADHTVMLVLEGDDFERMVQGVTVPDLLRAEYEKIRFDFP